MKGIKGTHLNWSVQPAGFAPPRVPGGKVVQDWGQCLHSGCGRVQLRDLWFVLASALSKTVSESRTAVALICYRGCSSSPTP